MGFTNTVPNGADVLLQDGSWNPDPGFGGNITSFEVVALDSYQSIILAAPGATQGQVLMADWCNATKPLNFGSTMAQTPVGTGGGATALIGPMMCNAGDEILVRLQAVPPAGNVTVPGVYIYGVRQKLIEVGQDGRPKQPQSTLSATAIVAASGTASLIAAPANPYRIRVAAASIAIGAAASQYQISIQGTRNGVAGQAVLYAPGTPGVATKEWKDGLLFDAGAGVNLVSTAGANAVGFATVEYMITQ